MPLEFRLRAKRFGGLAEALAEAVGVWRLALEVTRHLSTLDVLSIDCQATAAAPRGCLLELGWAPVGAAPTRAEARLVRLPAGHRIPPAVTRITGISESIMCSAVDAHDAWRELSACAARLTPQPAPGVAHFARFERPFLESLSGGAFPVDLVCTHEIARRLLPDLPRCTLRALAGYFGRAVSTLRRSSDHVVATAFVWHELVRLLDAEGISTWEALKDWLATPVIAKRSRRRIWPMPRDLRLALPDAPGIYRMLRTSGDILYVGKASSLRHRVNSYFRKQHGIHERTLEMLSQARAVSFEVTPTILEAALLEPDEIKRCRAPYNRALVAEGRALWFAAGDLSEWRPRRSPRCTLGPFPSGEMLDQFAALAGGSTEALGRGRWAPARAVFAAGYSRFCAIHSELHRDDVSARAKLLCLGTRLWREGRRDRDDDGDEGVDRTITNWTPEQVQTSLERLALRAALARRRARWFTRLAEAAVIWAEPSIDGVRLIVIEHGEVSVRASAAAHTTPPIPPGCCRSVAARHDAFTIAGFDRLRVLTIELKRLVVEGSYVAVRLGAAPAVSGERLAYALSWV